MRVSIRDPLYISFLTKNSREMEEKARDEEEDRKNREFKEEKQRQAEQVISEKQAKGELLSSDIEW